MTKKEELIDFVRDNINETNYLHCEVFYTTFNESGTRGYAASKNNLIRHLKNNFDDNCIENTDDGVVIEILTCKAEKNN